MNDVIAKRYWNLIFGDSAQFLNAYFSTMVNNAGIHLTKEHNFLVALCVFIKYNYVFCSKQIPMAYLTGVMTLPAYRRLGYMQQSLHSALNSMKCQNYDICSLIPADDSLRITYEHFGFSSVFTKQKPTTQEKTVLHEEKDIKLHKRLGYDLSKPYTHGNGMLRIINPKNILSLYAAANPQEEIAFSLKDDLIETNNLSYIISKGHLEKSHEFFKPLNITELNTLLFSNSYMDCMFDE